MQKRTACSFILVIALIFTAGQSLAAGPTSVDISAVVLSKSICRFVTNATTLPFGNLDPSNPVLVNGTATLTFRCQGSADPATFLMSSDDGLHSLAAGAPRMQHVTTPTEYIPYTVSLSPVSGTVPKNVFQNLTITGSIPGANYQAAIAGDYADTITISIIP